jgi:hypothetical protein
VQYFLDIVLERDVRNQAGIADFLNFGIKCREISIPSEGNNAVRIMTIHKSKGWNFSGNHAFAEEDYSRKLKINYGLMEKKWILVCQSTSR